MPSAVIRSGVCGFVTRAAAECQDGVHVGLVIDSDCPIYHPVAEELAPFSAQ